MTEAALAEPGQRLLARIVDTLIVGVPAIAVVRALVSGPTEDVVAPPVLAGCMLLYEAVQLALWGRTVGKRVAGIEVVVAVPGALTPGGTAATSGLGEAGAAAPASGSASAPGSVQAVGDELTSRGTDAETGSEPVAEPSSSRAEVGVGTGAEATAQATTETATHTGAGAGAGTGAMEPIQNPEAFPSPGTSPEQTPGDEAGAGPTSDGRTERVPISERSRLGVVQALVRAAVYSLPIAARPIPVAGVLAGIFWLTNAGALYEGTHRQALHDRLTGTLVVKRSPTDSSAF